MRYLLTWTCRLCHRRQKTHLETGQPWPSICAECRTDPPKTDRASGSTPC